MSTASGERRLRLAASRQALYSIPLNELFELPGRPHVVWMLRSYADAVNPAEAAQQARTEVPFLFKAFETGQIGPKRMAKMHGGKPRMSTIHEYLDWTVTAQAAQEDDELDFGGFRVLLLLPRYVPHWPYPNNPSNCVGKRTHTALGPPLPPLPFLQAHGKPLSAATIRSGPGYLEVPFVATHEGKRGKGYCRCLLEAMEDISRALGLHKLLLCSTNDPLVKSTWHHLGFDFTTEEQMHTWDTPHSDLVYLQNTTQMHKELPPAGQYKAVRIKHGLFQQRVYARLDVVPKRPKLHMPPPKKAPPKKVAANLHSQPSSMSLSLPLSRHMALPAPSSCTSYLTANTATTTEATPSGTQMEVNQKLPPLQLPPLQHQPQQLGGQMLQPLNLGGDPHLAQPPQQQHQHQQHGSNGLHEAQSSLQELPAPIVSLPLNTPVLALGDDPPGAPLHHLLGANGPSRTHSPISPAHAHFDGSAGALHMPLARLHNSPVKHSPLRVVSGPSVLGQGHGPDAMHHPLVSHASNPLLLSHTSNPLPSHPSNSLLPSHPSNTGPPGLSNLGPGGMVPSSTHHSGVVSGLANGMAAGSLTPASNGGLALGLAAAGAGVMQPSSTMSGLAATGMVAQQALPAGNSPAVHSPLVAAAAAAMTTTTVIADGGAGASPAAALMSAAAPAAAGAPPDPQQEYVAHMKALQRQQMQQLQMKAQQQQQQQQPARQALQAAPAALTQGPPHHLPGSNGASAVVAVTTPASHAQAAHAASQQPLLLQPPAAGPQQPGVAAAPSDLSVGVLTGSHVSISQMFPSPPAGPALPPLGAGAPTQPSLQHPSISSASCQPLAAEAISNLLSSSTGLVDLASLGLPADLAGLQMQQVWGKQ